MPQLPFERPRIGPGLSLYLLAPVVAELMLGSSPPVVFALFSWSHILLYGGAAVLARELAFRWHKGWPTIIGLGVAFAILYQGIVLRWFFDPAAAPLAELKNYGWFAGANWIWITSMSLYDSLVGIALPILLVNVAYPDRVDEPWVRGRWLRLVMLGLLVVTLVWLPLHSADVDVRLIVTAALAIEVVGAIAFFLPTRMPVGVSTGPAPSPVRVVGTVALCVLAIYFWGVSLFGPPIVPIVCELGTAGVLLVWLARSSRKPDWTDLHRFAVAVGVFVCMWIYSPLVELSGGFGQLIVAGVSIWISRRVWVVLAREGEAGEETDGAGEAEEAEDDGGAKKVEWGFGPPPRAGEPGESATSADAAAAASSSGRARMATAAPLDATETPMTWPELPDDAEHAATAAKHPRQARPKRTGRRSCSKP